jgi:hypothetical protein
MGPENGGYSWRVPIQQGETMDQLVASVLRDYEKRSDAENIRFKRHE